MSKAGVMAVLVFAGSLLICSLAATWGADDGGQPIAAHQPATTRAATGPTTMAAAELAGKVIAIFSNKCTECHSPDATADDAEEARQSISDMTDLEIVRKHVKPGDLKGSGLWNAVNPDNPAMPPNSATGGKLTDEETEIIKQWILAGAPLASADTQDNGAGQQPEEQK